MPAIDKPWSGDDMARAFSVLEAIFRNDPLQLPRFGSAKSGKMFERMTSREGLSYFRDRSLPIHTRLPQALTFHQSLNNIFKSYYAAFMRKTVSDTEVIELTCAALRVTLVMIELLDEFFPTLDKNDRSYAVRVEGFEKAKTGATVAVTGMIIVLSEREVYRSSERIKLITSLEENLPRLLPHLPRGSQSDIAKQLESLAKDPAYQDLQPALGKLAETVRAAVEKGAP
jgi:hypothetical protein